MLISDKRGVSLLIVEDDTLLLQRLAQALESRGFDVATAGSVADGLSHVEQNAPAFAVVDIAAWRRQRHGNYQGAQKIQAEQDRAGNRDPAHYAYPTYAKAAGARRDNLKRSVQDLKIQLANVKMSSVLQQRGN